MDLDSILEAMGNAEASDSTVSWSAEDLTRIIAKLDALLAVSGVPVPVPVPDSDLPREAARAWVAGDLVEAVIIVKRELDLDLSAAHALLRETLGEQHILTLIERRVDSLLEAAGGG